jgi:hypothetical protein
LASHWKIRKPWISEKNRKSKIGMVQKLSPDWRNYFQVRKIGHFNRITTRSIRQDARGGLKMMLLCYLGHPSPGFNPKKICGLIWIGDMNSWKTKALQMLAKRLGPKPQNPIIQSCFTFARKLI